MLISHIKRFVELKFQAHNSPLSEYTTLSGRSFADLLKQNKCLGIIKICLNNLSGSDISVSRRTG